MTRDQIGKPDFRDVDRDELPTPRRYLAIATIVAGLTLAVLDGTIATVA